MRSFLKKRFIGICSLAFRQKDSVLLVFKVPHGGDHHCQFIFHTVIDRIFVADGPTWLNKGGDPGGVGDLYAIVKGEKGIGGQDGAFQIKVELAGFGDGLAEGVDPAGLSAAFADELAVFNEGDRVGFEVFANEVSEFQVFFFRGGSRAAAGFFPFAIIAFILLLL